MAGRQEDLRRISLSASLPPLLFLSHVAHPSPHQSLGKQTQGDLSFGLNPDGSSVDATLERRLAGGGRVQVGGRDIGYESMRREEGRV
jgi:hypothetical protein